MTIDEALEEMNTLIIPRDGIQDKLADAYDMSIASLEAWEKVRQEIGKLSLSWEYGQGVVDCLAIIDHYMQEVGNGQTE